ncbi:MAG: FHA domain-containing protein [Gemmatimonadetes bacterium]|nr:FHA domain-containing protein [Gemmatimonadota bacterium]
MSSAGIELQIEDERSGIARVLRFEPDTGPIVIGRDEESHVHLAAQSISRRHAVIEKAPDGFVVTDESSLGTQRNGEPLPKKTATLLSDGDVLTMPGFQITLHIDGAKRNIEDTGGFHDLLAMAKDLDSETEGESQGEDGPVTGTIHVVIDENETAQESIGGEGSTLLIGGSGECHVRLDDPYRIISGLHAKIERSWAGTFLYDLSRNGVYVNGEPIEDVRDLKDGDRITLAIAEAKAAAPTLVYREAGGAKKAGDAGSGGGAGDSGTGAAGGPLGSFGGGDFDPGERASSEEHPWAAEAEESPGGKTSDRSPGAHADTDGGGGAGTGEPGSEGALDSQVDAHEGDAHGGAHGDKHGEKHGATGHESGAGADENDSHDTPPGERDLFTLIVIGVAAVVIILFAVIGFMMFNG